MNETPEAQCGSDALGAVERRVQFDVGLLRTRSNGLLVGFASESEGGE